MLGGMMIPMTAADAVIAPARGDGYPCLTIGGTRSPPIAAASATAEPQMPPKNMLLTPEHGDSRRACGRGS